MKRTPFANGATSATDTNTVAKNTTTAAAAAAALLLLLSLLLLLPLLQLVLLLHLAWKWSGVEWLVTSFQDLIISKLKMVS